MTELYRPYTGRFRGYKVDTGKAPRNKHGRYRVPVHIPAENPLSGLSPLDGRAHDTRPSPESAVSPLPNGPSGPGRGTRPELIQPGAPA